MQDALDPLRRQAKTLHKQYEAGDTTALERVAAVIRPGGKPLKRADFLHVIAIERSFASWPQMKEAVRQAGVVGLQKRYQWVELEPSFGNYDFLCISSSTAPPKLLQDGKSL